MTAGAAAQVLDTCAHVQDDEEFVDAFLAGEIAAGEFHHRDHLRLAWTIVLRSPLTDALQTVSQGLRDFTQRVGAENLYNETVTWTYVFAVHQTLMELGPDHAGRRDFDRFLELNAQLLEPVDTFMSRYYPNHSWKSELARSGFVLPTAAQQPEP